MRYANRKTLNHVSAVIASATVFVGALAGYGLTETSAAASTDVEPRPVKTLTVEARSTQIRRVYPAVVLPAQEATLSFRVPGQIVELPIRGALRVESGDLIARLDTRDFRTEHARLETQLARARAQLQVLTSGARTEDVAAMEAEVAAARAQAEGAAVEVERLRGLVEHGVVPKADLDRAVTNLRVAEATLEAKSQALIKSRSGAREEDVAAQEAGIEELELAVASAGAKLDDARLRAPFSGIIAKRLVDNFANVQAKEPIAVLQKLDTLSLSFDVPGPDVVELARRTTLSAVAVLDSLPGQEFEATFEEFSTQADPATQTYRGRLTISAVEGAFVLPGMVGRIIVSDQDVGRSEIAVPLTALASDADGTLFVWVVTGTENRVARREIKLGEAEGSGVVVLEGLAEGDVVVTAGVSKLRDGMQVRPITTVGD